MSQDPISQQDLGLLPLEVAHTSFLLERLGQDCEPLQYLRELTQNSLEAIGRTKQPGDMLWQATPVSFPSGTSGLKLSITDTGDGMTAAELEGHINRLSSSGGQQTHAGNFGVGAKIATALGNPAGVRYRSWKQGRGHEILLCRDADGRYGLRQYALGDDQYSYSPAVPEDHKPAMIGTHGTEVTLMGQSEEANTALPAGTTSPAWITKYLNSRYYRFPQSVSVRVDEASLAGHNDPAGIRTLTGQKAYLDEHCEASGMTKLTGAVAHWWILLPDTRSLHADAAFIESAGHTAALYKDELYELRSGRNGVARLQQFGITFGFRRVVIYVEPRNHKYRQIGSNTARSHLLVNRQPLPWATWAAEFAKKLPVELRELVAAEGAARQPDHSLSVQRRLSKIMDLFKPRRYRLNAKGKEQADVESCKAAKSGPTQAGTKKAAQKRNAKHKSPKAADTGKPAEKSLEPQNTYPKTGWISREDGTRAVGFLEDRAAAYLPEQNLLQINRDFSVFADTIAYCRREFAAAEGVQEVMQDTVYSWYEQALVESVLGMCALRNAKEWSDRDLERALSPEAMTAAVMQRYHIIAATRESLRRTLGGVTAARKKAANPATPSTLCSQDQNPVRSRIPVLA